MVCSPFEAEAWCGHHQVSTSNMAAKMAALPRALLRHWKQVHLWRHLKYDIRAQFSSILLPLKGQSPESHSSNHFPTR